MIVEQALRVGVPVGTASFVPRDQVCMIGGRAFIHPITYLRAKHPQSPIWSERTLGHREAGIDRRRHR